MSTYNPNIPQPNNLLSNSQADILNNFNSADSTFDLNHYKFSDVTTNKGKHKYVTLPVLGALPATVAGDGVLYTKSTGGVAALFYSPDASGKEYQITRTNTTDHAKFGTQTNYSGNIFGGWTFLPGGLKANYGFLNVAASSGTITYASAFTTGAYSIQIQLAETTGLGTTATAETNTPTGFNFLLSNSRKFYFLAIGK